MSDPDKKPPSDPGDPGRMLDMIYEIFKTAPQAIKDTFPDEVRRRILARKMIIHALETGANLQMIPMDVMIAGTEFQLSLLQGFKMFADKMTKDEVQDQGAMNEVAKKILAAMDEEDKDKPSGLDRK